jgi:hypothetical protein
MNFRSGARHSWLPIGSHWYHVKAWKRALWAGMPRGCWRSSCRVQGGYQCLFRVYSEFLDGVHQNGYTDFHRLKGPGLVLVPRPSWEHLEIRGACRGIIIRVDTGIVTLQRIVASGLDELKALGHPVQGCHHAIQVDQEVLGCRGKTGRRAAQSASAP